MKSEEMLCATYFFNRDTSEIIIKKIMKNQHFSSPTSQIKARKQKGRQCRG